MPQNPQRLTQSDNSTLITCSKVIELVVESIPKERLPHMELVIFLVLTDNCKTVAILILAQSPVRERQPTLLDVEVKEEPQR